MPRDKLQRQQLIRNAVNHRPNPVARSSVQLWEQLANELVSIVGEGGFQSLYARTILLNSKHFPWIVEENATSLPSQRFASLERCFAKQTEKVIYEANSALLITFIDILALLIGELLTSRILDSAWGGDASAQAN